MSWTGVILHSNLKPADSPLIIVGAGRFGQELKVGLETYGGHQFLGFIDDVSSHAKVLGSIKNHSPISTVQYLVAIGNSIDRLRVGLDLMAKGAKLGSVLSPRAWVAHTYRNVPGTMLLGTPDVSANVTLGRLVIIHGFAVVAHDCVIADGVTISNHVFVGGGASIGEAATLHPHSVILPNVIVGARSIVGAGSVVTKNVPDDCTVFGSPARVIFKGTPNRET